MNSIQGTEIKENAKYQGVRITGNAVLDRAKITFQMDVGFGDAVIPAAQIRRMKSYLDMPEPKLRVYPVYTVIAEKFQAMASLGLANSRIKDFYDVWVISREIDLLKRLRKDRDSSRSQFNQWIGNFRGLFKVLNSEHHLSCVDCFRPLAMVE